MCSGWISSTLEVGVSRLLAGLRATGLDPTDSFAWDPHRSPYPGLAAFRRGGRRRVLRLASKRSSGWWNLLQPTLQHGPADSWPSSGHRAAVSPRLAARRAAASPGPPTRAVGAAAAAAARAGEPTRNLAGCLARAFANRSASPARRRAGRMALVGMRSARTAAAGRASSPSWRQRNERPPGGRAGGHRPGRGAGDPHRAGRATGVPGAAYRGARRGQPAVGGRHRSLGVPFHRP